MSYMVILKNKNGIIICSDSYSTYSNRELKDGNYQKIYKINDKLVVASTGINQIYDDNNQLYDIWDYIKGLFKDVNNIEKLSEIVEKYIEKLQITCDREEKDNTTVFVIDNYVVVIDILHARGHYINNLKPFYRKILSIDALDEYGTLVSNNPTEYLVHLVEEPETRREVVNMLLASPIVDYCTDGSNKYTIHIFSMSSKITTIEIVKKMLINVIK